MGVDQATIFYLTQGVLGVSCIVLATVIVLQDRRYRQDLREKDLAISTLQDKRVIEGKDQREDFLVTSQTLLQQMRDMLNVEVANQKAIETIADILRRK